MKEIAYFQVLLQSGCVMVAVVFAFNWYKISRTVLVDDYVAKPYWLKNYNAIPDRMRLLGIDAIDADLTNEGLIRNSHSGW